MAVVGFDPDDFRKRFAGLTIEECIERFNGDVHSRGWVSARGRFHSALMERFLGSGYDCSDFIYRACSSPERYSMSVGKRIGKRGSKIVQIE